MSNVIKDDLQSIPISHLAHYSMISSFKYTIKFSVRILYETIQKRYTESSIKCLVKWVSERESSLRNSGNFLGFTWSGLEEMIPPPWGCGRFNNLLSEKFNQLYG